MKYVLIWLGMHFLAVGIGWTCDIQGWVIKPEMFWFMGWLSGFVPLTIVMCLIVEER